MSSAKIPQNPERILLVLPTWVGDVVMATPFLKAVFEHFPESKITLLMQPHLQDILQGSPWVERCCYWPRKGGNKREYKQLYNKFVDELKAQHFDLAILLPNSIRVAWLAFRIGARRRVGFNRDGRGWLLTDRLPVPNKVSGGYTPLPLVEYYQVLAEYLGCPSNTDALHLFNTPDQDQHTLHRLQAAGINDFSQVVVVCPGANFGASKCWPPERFAAVADQLVSEHKMQIVISPGPGEEPLAEAIADNMQHPSLLLTQPCLTLAELKSLIKHSALLLGNDTGPRHFARAFDTPRVTVFGPTETRWTDISSPASGKVDRETIVRVDVPCGPCHKKVCPLETQVCMQQVTVNMVAQACSHQLTYRK